MQPNEWKWVFILMKSCIILTYTLHWCHNELDGVSDHQPRDCLLTCLFRHRSKKISKLRVTGLCEGNSPGTVEFPAQKASNAENVSIWWHHHDLFSPNCHELIFPSDIISLVVLSQMRGSFSLKRPQTEHNQYEIKYDNYEIVMWFVYHDDFLPLNFDIKFLIHT